jgi:hypothetical protein
MPLFQDAIAFQLFPLNFKWGKGLCLRGLICVQDFMAECLLVALRLPNKVLLCDFP